MKSRFGFALSGLAALCFAASCGQTADAPAFASISKLPETLDPNCLDGRAKIYDQCSDQTQLFDQALERANAENKFLLVSYGAEWCIWCHVFDLHIKGYSGEFEYTYGERENPTQWTDTFYERSQEDVESEARALNQFIAETFVVAHIEADHAPGSDDVLIETSANKHFDNWIPFVFVVDRQGQFLGALKHDTVEVRRDTADPYRGYDRPRMIAEFEKIISQADTGG